MHAETSLIEQSREPAPSPSSSGSELFWPGHPDLSQSLLQVLATAQDGGAIVVETLAAARQIDPRAPASWTHTFTDLGIRQRIRGEHAAMQGHDVTAHACWRRAMAYQLAALLPNVGEETDRTAALELARAADGFLDALQPRGEWLSIECGLRQPLKAAFLPATAPGAAVVICTAEPGHRKEDILLTMSDHARNRGLALVALELPGDEVTAGLTGERMIRESIVSATIDHLEGREGSEIDVSRIGVCALGRGSSWTARNVAQEGRISAAACDGGLWDIHDQASELDHEPGAPDAAHLMRVGPAGRIRCPLLVTAGERGPWRATDLDALMKRLKVAGRDVTFRIFRDATTASWTHHEDNPGLANEVIFDWLSERL